MFEDNMDVKIGRILFQKETGKELYDIAMGLKKIYDDSGKKDKVAGTMAIETAVAAYFEGYEYAAALVCACMLDRTGYKGLSNILLQFEVFAEAGSSVSAFCANHLAEAYDKGHPPYIVQNSYMASMYYKKAADFGNKDSQLLVGNRYFQGDGVELDFDLAEKYWEMAAKQGVVDAQFNLGSLYDGNLEGGPSTMKFNPEKAGYWLALAARNGDRNAAELLNRRYRFNQRKNQWQLNV